MRTDQLDKLCIVIALWLQMRGQWGKLCMCSVQVVTDMNQQHMQSIVLRHWLRNTNRQHKQNRRRERQTLRTDQLDRIHRRGSLAQTRQSQQHSQYRL